MQLTNHMNISFLDFLLSLLGFFRTGRIEPIIKHLRVRKDFRQQKVQQTPQFMKIIL